MRSKADSSGAARGEASPHPYGWTSKNYVICVCFHCHGTSSYHARQIHCKAVEQRATLIHRQYNRDWGTSYSRPPIDPYLTSLPVTKSWRRRWLTDSTIILCACNHEDQLRCQYVSNRFPSIIGRKHYTTSFELNETYTDQITDFFMLLVCYVLLCVVALCVKMRCVIFCIKRLLTD